MVSDSFSKVDISLINPVLLDRSFTCILAHCSGSVGPEIHLQENSAGQQYESQKNPQSSTIAAA